ncbi:delta-class carbonic anhydrase [Rheinheimera soli]|uniref:Cadmium carbonic anhydrase n=1 Tax=Rheinheimera soli TaxID=443616 RepID=A0ABU1W4Z6_9GAMM|nr:delta-class carbonic anhydrase [Rheinheimera soli]MDR7123035.1 hypothetical protein [Rheinheimera soli]
MKLSFFSCLLFSAVVCSDLQAAKASHHAVSDEVIAQQNARLAAATKDKGYGPQSPRDIGVKTGNNQRVFGQAPSYEQMNLCNIHMHVSAEHKGGEFTTYAGPGDGKGMGSGYKYNGKLSKAELTPVKEPICAGEHGSLHSGDTIEVHYVHTSAMAAPGATLNACMSEAIKNPELRVEAQVFVLVNDSKALDFTKLAAVGMDDGYHQAPNIPQNTGEPVEYAGSTTGPDYNEVASPFQVSWGVRPKVAKVNIATVGAWCKANPFNESMAHGVRNLVTNPDLLSEIDD